MSLWRWVEIPVHTESLDEARHLLSQQAPKVRTFPGCRSVTLYEGDGPTLYSFSEWESAADLERYRQSALFREFWEKLRPHFREKPRAVSIRQLKYPHQTELEGTFEE